MGFRCCSEFCPNPMAMRVVAGRREYRSIAHLAFFRSFAFAPIMHLPVEDRRCRVMKTFHRNLDCIFFFFSQKERSEDSSEKRHSNLLEKLQWKGMCKEMYIFFSLWERRKDNWFKWYQIVQSLNQKLGINVTWGFFFLWSKSNQLLFFFYCLGYMAS
jgi:hypothetical protein